MPECPICGAPQEPKLRPFCSKRCADVDLGRWMLGAYALPAVEEDDPDGAERDPGRRADPDDTPH